MYSISCGPYDLQKVIGEGGMAKVWRGVHRAKQVPVAVKVVTAEHSLEAAYVDSFEREVQAVAALNHPGIVRVFDYGRITEETARGHQSLAAGSPYLVMELFEAGPLEPRRAITSWPEVCDFAFALLDTLAHAHARGVIHRDIKPDNILCEDAGPLTPGNRTPGKSRRYKLSDFGLAHASEEGVGEAVSAGTPQYMPPEQLTGSWRDFGPWTDLYALGCLIYELVCGKLPFDHEKLLRIVHLQMHEPLPPLEPRFAVPAGLEPFLRRMVAKKPSQRFRRAADAAFALAQLDAPVALGTVAPGTVPPSSKIDTDADTLMNTSPEAHTALQEGILPTRVSHDTVAELAQMETSRGMATLPLWEGAPAHVAESVAESNEGTLDTEETLSHFEPPPPLPDSWRLAEPETLSQQLDGTGLELFGLRAMPFSGRELERDEMWRVFREVFETQQLRVVSLRGPAGIGKSCLAEWMSHRVEEMGAANALKALHSSRSGANEGVPAMLERYFGVWHCSRRQILERIEERLEYLRATDAPDAPDPASESDDDVLARALTEIIRPAKADTAEDGPTYQFSSHGERYATVRELLERLGAERPVLIWLDDAVRSQMGLGFVRYLMEHDSTLPLMLVLTSSEETTTENTVAAGYLREIEADARVSRLDLKPMDTAAMGELIGQTLKLDDDLVARLQRRAQGLPLYVTQLLGDWVSQGALVDGEAGFRLREGDGQAFPVDIAQLWDRRIEQVLSRFEASRRQGLGIALELAATLGHQIDQAEWLAACEARGIDGAKQLLAAMFDENLARLTAPGALFSHELLTDRLVQRAQEAGRTRQNHRACARALEDAYPDSDVEAAVRSARHLMDAHAFEEALDKLEAILNRLRDSGDTSAAKSLLDLSRQAADRLALPDAHRRRVRHEWLRGHFLLTTGDLQDAQRRAEHALAAAERHGWHTEAGHAQLIKGRALMAQLELDRAMDCYGKAARHFEAAKDREGLARAQFGKGVILAQRLDYDAAEQCFKEATWCAELVDNASLRCKALVQLGNVWLGKGDHERAIASTEEAYALAEQVGSRTARASAARHLGEIARGRGDWPAARRWLQEAYDIALAAMMFARHYDRLNLALVDLETERYERAAGAFGELRERFAQAQDQMPLPLVDLALVLCAAGLGDEQQYTAHLARTLAGPAPRPNVRRDMVPIARKAADLAAGHGWAGVDELRELASRL